MGSSLVAKTVKNLTSVQKTQVQSLGQDYASGKEPAYQCRRHK